MGAAKRFRLGTAIRHWAREFVIIVLGVLVALWVDGSYQRREEREREQVGLEQLLAETGDLNLIRNDSLRATLATYTGVPEGTARQKHAGHRVAEPRAGPEAALRQHGGAPGRARVRAGELTSQAMIGPASRRQLSWPAPSSRAPPPWVR